MPPQFKVRCGVLTRIGHLGNYFLVLLPRLGLLVLLQNTVKFVSQRIYCIIEHKLLKLLRSELCAALYSSHVPLELFLLHRLCKIKLR